MILSGQSRGFFMEKFWSQKAHFETICCTELVTEHLIKFKKKINAYL